MTYHRTTWRLVKTAPAPGAWNMALDEAILEAAGSGNVPPTLRLYAWQPACLSLGYAQPVADVDRASLERFGWHLVRRPTGGRAILHTDELTYSVSGPPSEARLAGGVLESYRVLAQALLEALHLLNIPAMAIEKPAALAAEPTPGSTPGTKNPVCFEAPSNYEITVHGKKLLGSAQARRKEGVLQHGSLPLFGDLTRITMGLVFADEMGRQRAAQRLLERATTSETVLGHPLAWEDAAQAFLQSFAATLNLELQPGELTQEELARAETLLVEKFNNPHWTERI